MFSAALSSKGQLTIPADVRADLRLSTGDRVSFEKAEDGSYRIRPLKRDIRQLAGILKYDGPPVSIEDMNLAVLDGAAERYRRAVER
jgi:AbrB family looped-hinge helix DNA binding protein